MTPWFDREGEATSRWCRILVAIEQKRWLTVTTGRSSWVLNSPSMLARSCNCDVCISYSSLYTTDNSSGILTSLGRFLIGEAVSAIFVRLRYGYLSSIVQPRQDRTDESRSSESSPAFAAMVDQIMLPITKNKGRDRLESRDNPTLTEQSLISGPTPNRPTYGDSLDGRSRHCH